MYRHKRHPPLDKQRRRRGYMLVEMIVAGIVLAVVMTVYLQLLAATSRQHRYADHRQLAGEELANIMERITAQPYKTIDQEELQSKELSDSATSHLHDAELNIDILPVSEPVDGKQISLSLRWRDSGDVYVAPTRLTSWVYAPAGGTP
ncbi:hypothetical protein CA54_15190 [Symmachiella macrocystis]|uniref:Prepilin-type N-terminal cleavage/methylation domain-containing protein n=1 Tax=Symmachiella macrocystis TaxID=2527985 RepID=A0A5C6BQ07_9PLAN|nr:hypothetical protein [Symmachiella macrocystis]TWU12694.1 hypothetical protein CA54_15190 [Symmachiella macrocystis]